MTPSDHDNRDRVEGDPDRIQHGVVDEAAGDEGIDDPQADDSDTPSMQAHSL